MKTVNNQGKNIYSRIILSIGLVFMFLLVIQPTLGQEWAMTQTIQLEDGATEDYLGYSVALSGDRMLLGAPRSRNGVYGSSGGAAYIFERQTDGNWMKMAKLSPDNWYNIRDINFGAKVTLEKDIALVTVLPNEIFRKNGAVFVFERQTDGNWTQTAAIADSVDFNDDYPLLGSSIAVHENQMFIGSSRNNGMGRYSGIMYVYERQPNGSWKKMDELFGSDTDAGDFFGASVDVFQDRAVIGAFGADSMNFTGGAVYMFEKQSDGSWEEMKIFRPKHEADKLFGISVALTENRFIVGTQEDSGATTEQAVGSGTIFERQVDGVWKSVAKLYPDSNSNIYGVSVDIEEDLAVVGFYTNTDSTPAFLFARKPDGQWIERSPLIPQLRVTYPYNIPHPVSLSQQRVLLGSFFNEIRDDLSGIGYLFEAIPSCTVVNTFDDGPGSLRDLVVNHLECDIIYFDPSLEGKTVSLTSGQIPVERNVVIWGLAGTPSAISGNDQSRIFEVAVDKQVSFHRLRLTQGRAEREGGAILNRGDLRITDCVIEYNEVVPSGSSSIASGGAIENRGQLDIRRSRLDYNTAGSGGGAISNYAFSTIYGESLELRYNTAFGFGGGAIYNGSQTQARFERSTFSQNNGLKGGAFFNQGTLNITACTIIENQADRGGAIHNSRSSGQVFVSESVLKDNQAKEQGGACWTQIGKLTIEQSNVNGNGITSTGESCQGGALYIDRGQVNILNSSLNFNYLESTVARASGGAIYNLSGELYMEKIQMNTNTVSSETYSEGAALYNGSEASARLLDCFLSSNSLVAPGAGGAGIHNSGDLRIEKGYINSNTITETAIEAYGGGIFNNGSVYIAQTYIGGNILKSFSNAAGAGIYNNTGDIEILNTTFSANKALGQELPISSRGGGIFNKGGSLSISGSTMNLFNTATYGGALYNEGGTFELTNSTLSGNTADKGAGLFNDTQGVGYARFTTITANLAELSQPGVPQGGGVFNQGQFEPINTLIAGNFKQPTNSAKLPSDVYGSLQSQGHNLIGVDDFGFSPSENDLFGTIENPLDAQLEALADNGGPTFTHALSLCSPAIDAAVSISGIDTDQRAYNRAIGAANDIGAYEWGASEEPNPATTLIITEAVDGAEGSLRATVASAQAGATLVFDPALEGTTLSIDGALGEILIDKPLSIQGSGAHLLSLRMELESQVYARFFRIAACAKVKLSGMSLSGGSAPIEGPQTDYFSRGGAIFNEGELEMREMVLTDNHSEAAGHGGGIYNAMTASLYLYQSSLYANHSTGVGGAVYNLGEMEIVNSTIAQNYINAQATEGVGLYNAGVMRVNFSTIAYNHALASSRGVGLYNLGDLSLSNSILAQNTAQVGPNPNNIFVKDGFNENNAIFHDLGYNLISDNSSLQLASDQGNLLNQDPLLGEFEMADNAPPFYPLNGWENSPCIEAANPNSPPPTDQRGMPRPTPAGSKPDIGAYEYMNPLAVDDIDTRSFIQVYPNPANREVWIAIEQELPQQFLLSVRNQLGQLIVHEQLNGNKTRLDVGDWPAGLYQLIFTEQQSQQIVSVKLLKY